MTHLEFMAARWLQWEKGCALVLCERTPRWGHGQPDVLGILPSRFILEIEIKRSVSDFRANAKKWHMQNRLSHESEISSKAIAKAPKLFWFLVPREIVPKIQNEVPDFAGLLTPADHGKCLEVIKKSPSNSASERLSLKECSKLMRCAGNMMIAMMAGIYAARQWGPGDPHFMDDFFSEPKRQAQLIDGHFQYTKTPSDYINFQI